MTATKNALLVVAGPTATGKTRAAIALARRFNGELVGADSVQVYRGFNIGSAKPPREELGDLAHHMIDIVDPDEAIDAVRYAELADEAIEGAHARGNLPIVVGGTGLWIRALARGLIDLPPVDRRIRERLQREADALGTPSLHAKLGTVDPVAATAIHPNDRVRVIRALEVYEQTGRPLGTLRSEHALGAPRYRVMFVVLDMERDAHTAAIEGRIQTMLEGGWIDEVRALRARWGDEVRALSSVGYREVMAHLRERVPWDEMVRRIRKSTRTYARHQRTWFRGEPGVSWRTRHVDLLTPKGQDRIARELLL